MPLYPALTGTTANGAAFSLARLRREDLPQIIEPFQNLELTTYLRGYGFTASEAEQAEWLESALKNSPNQTMFGIYDASETLIGSAALRDIDDRSGTAELGVAIYQPRDWGAGYGSAATRLICQYGAFHLGLYNIMLKVFAFNERAIRTYQKVGFREIGRRTGAVRLGRERFDEVYMELLTDELDTSELRAQLQQMQ
ncbi:GNAT family N-acetyltransferase [Deinococcus detaillensis]|uniref:GNAT family N-acetyltransferase n=1 Tax=Deinococcus detaillensis TaxID=2592048 RepID=A0A553V458_9DEIO|nr:GNAT family protein [Deinococcus detaillensis]TSA87239.1 GNAT family N-acetyltransferase [Deinococcus detaillensis]